MSINKRRLMDEGQSDPLIKQRIHDFIWESTTLMFMFNAMFICCLWRKSEFNEHHFFPSLPYYITFFTVYCCSEHEDRLTAVRNIQEGQKCGQIKVYKHIRTLTCTFPPHLIYASKIRIFILVMRSQITAWFWLVSQWLNTLKLDHFT